MAEETNTENQDRTQTTLTPAEQAQRDAAYAQQRAARAQEQAAEAEQQERAPRTGMRVAAATQPQRRAEQPLRATAPYAAATSVKEADDDKRMGWWMLIPIAIAILLGGAALYVALSRSGEAPGLTELSGKVEKIQLDFLTLSSNQETLQGRLDVQGENLQTLNETSKSLAEGQKKADERITALENVKADERITALEELHKQQEAAKEAWRQRQLAKKATGKSNGERITALEERLDKVEVRVTGLETKPGAQTAAPADSKSSGAASLKIETF